MYGAVFSETIVGAGAACIQGALTFNDLAAQAAGPEDVPRLGLPRYPGRPDVGPGTQPVFRNMNNGQFMPGPEDGGWTVDLEP